jgi:hypothetical protein
MPRTSTRQARLNRQMLRLIDRRERVKAQLRTLDISLHQLDQEIERNHAERLEADQEDSG